MRINFLVYDFGRNGGSIDIVKMANGLVDLGHEVRILIPDFTVPSLFDDFRTFATDCMRNVRTIFNKRVMLDMECKARILRVPFLSEKYVPDADFSVCTWWQTAYDLKKLSYKKGKPIYFCQHFEIWGGKYSRVVATYKMGFLNVVHSNWLADQLFNIGARVDAVIPHSPDKSVFRPFKDKISGSKIFVLMPYRKESWKGGDIGLEAFNKARESVPELYLVAVGDGKIVESEQVIDMGLCGSQDMAGHYNYCKIFVNPSLVEGFCLPPFESACCGCPVITTDVGAVPDFFKDGRDALIVPPGNVTALADRIIQLAKDKRLREKLSRNALKTMRGVSWNKSARMLEKFLEAHR